VPAKNEIGKQGQTIDISRQDVTLHEATKEDAMTKQATRPKPQETLKLSEFAATLGVSTKTVRRWIKAGDIEAHKTPGGHWRIFSDQLTNRDLTVVQFARLVGVHPITVRRWCHTDKIVHSTTKGGYYRIPMGEVPRIGRRRRTR
jgi:excisionase family DNA binding protein